MVRKEFSEEEIREQIKQKVLKKKLEKEYEKELKQQEIQEKQKQKEREKFVGEVFKKQVDKRFEQEDLLFYIHQELEKDHLEDHREKLATFIVAVSAYLPNPKNHVSSAFKGNSSTGKDNIVFSVLKHFPKTDWARATRITQSEVEDRINSWKILWISEINKFREGANTEIAETFKQVMEDGIRIFKKDMKTGESKEIEVEQKTGFYGTTETETDDELDTRYIIIPVRGTPTKNRKVVDDTLNKVSDIEFLFDNKEPETWISKSIKELDKQLDVIIPFAKEINKRFKTEEGEKELFDYSKERVKRDVKRLMSLTKAIAWLFQKRRAIIEKENKKAVIAEPADFLTALDLFLPFFNVSYSGLDPRIEETYQKAKALETKHSSEIRKVFGDSFDKTDWVIRTNLQRELKVSVNTIKNYIDKLKDEGLIEVYWNESYPKYYLIRPVSIPISRLLEPITLQALTGHLIGYSQVLKLYKEYGRSQLDTNSLIKSINFFSEVEEIDRSKLTGVNGKESVVENNIPKPMPDWSDSDKERMEKAGGNP